jgi:predicted nucleic acid-binding protein
VAGVIVADTSWVAALRDPLDVHHAAAVAVEGGIGDEAVLIAAVTLAECLVAPARLRRLDEAESALRAAFDVEAPDATAPRRWAQRRADSGLRLPDAIVLETALHQQARALVTFDRRLADGARAAGLTVLGAKS